MRLTRLPYDTPRDEAKTSAILIGRGILALVIAFGSPWFLWILKGGPNYLDIIIILIIGGALFGGLAMMLSGTWLGFHSIYRLWKLKERLGYAWVSIIALPVTLILVLFFFIAITYRGP